MENSNLKMWQLNHLGFTIFQRLQAVDNFHLSLRLNTSLESGFDLINLGQKYREGPTIFSPSKINACLMKNGESHNNDNWGEKNIFSKRLQFSQLIS